MTLLPEFLCEEWGKHEKTIFAAREGITYSFDNGQTVTFQYDFKYSEDVPFTIYFDFETSTGDSVIFDSRMFVVSYCQIYLFHPFLSLDKIVIFWRFQQTVEEIYDLSHFRQEHILLFNKTTFYQLKDAASAVLACEKSTSLAELFSVELKFTVDTLNEWFSRIIKPKFFELDNIKKQIYLKENPMVRSETKYSICGFPIDAEGGDGWFDFVVKCEHLFLRNIYTFNELEQMDIETEEKYCEIIYRLLE